MSAKDIAASPLTDTDPVAAPLTVNVRAVVHAAAVVAVSALPVRAPVTLAVIVPAVKFPLPSRRTRLLVPVVPIATYLAKFSHVPELLK